MPYPFGGGFLKPEAEPLSGRAVAVFAILGIAIFYLSFWQNQPCLMLGLDGTWYRTMFASEVFNRLPFSPVGVDPQSGNFDAWYPLSPALLLPHALTLPFSAMAPTKPFIFAVFSTFLASSIYAVARVVDVGRAAALTAAFLMPILAAAGLAGGSAEFYPLFEANPYWFQSTGLGCLIVAAFWRLQGPPSARTMLLVIAPTLCLLLAVLSEAPHVLFMVPIAGAYAGGSLLATRRMTDAALRVVAALLMIIVPAALGVFTYYYGIIDYTAYRFFPDEIGHPLGGWMAFSTVTWSTLGAGVIVLGIASAAWIALAGSGRLRWFAVTHLIASAAYFAIAYALSFLAGSYRSSWPVYFETGIWPYALVFCAIALASLLRLVLGVYSAALQAAQRRLRQHDGHVVKKLGVVSLFGLFGMMMRHVGWLRLRSASVILLGVIAFVPVKNLTVLRAGLPNPCTGAAFFPIRATPITEVLQREISLRAGEPFRGMVANVNGVPPDGVGDWIKYHHYDAVLSLETGNDHRTVGLWEFHIPTLYQYHTFITPPYYLIVTDFAASRADHQLRSVIVISRIDPLMMALWGVRYVITDKETTAGREVVRLPTRHAGTLHLVELANPNVGDYSPVEQVRVSDFAGALHAMHQAGFDGSRTVVTMDQTLERPLAPARQAKLVYTKQGFHLTAKSDGRSVLVLPVQYSHCWTVQGIGNPMLFRADAMQLGVSFSGKLDASLIFRLGPILAGRCRIDDLHDVERLHIDQARSVGRE